MPTRFTSVVLLLLAISGSVVGDDVSPTYPLILFDGTNLDRWAAIGNEFTLDGRAVLQNGGTGLLRAHHRFSDFVLELKWRARSPEARGAVCFRSPLPAPGQYLPSRYLINLQPGLEGTLEGTGIGGKPDLIRHGDWNEMRLQVAGTHADLEINGRNVWRFDGLTEPSGWLGLYADTFCGGPLEFKDIAVTEFGFRSLCNGTDLSGWEGGGSDAAQCWKVEDGLLMCTGQKGPWLRSCEQFDDFNLRLEYKLRPGGNSGVYIRVPADGDHHGEGAGIEIQVLDDAAERYKTLKPYQYTGSLYAIVPANPRVARPAGNWNTMEINCRGTNYRVTHNGVDVIAADENAAAEIKQRLVKGFLGLQNHSEEVWFRNLRIGPAE